MIKYYFQGGFLGREIGHYLSGVPWRALTPTPGPPGSSARRDSLTIPAVLSIISLRWLALSAIRQ